MIANSSFVTLFDLLSYLNGNQSSGSPPTSAVSAFYRWLEVVSSHDWNEAPLLTSPECQVQGFHSLLQKPDHLCSVADPDPHRFGNSNPGLYPDSHQSERLDPDPIIYLKSGS